MGEFDIDEALALGLGPLAYSGCEYLLLVPAAARKTVYAWLGKSPTLAELHKVVRLFPCVTCYAGRVKLSLPYGIEYCQDFDDRMYDFWEEFAVSGYTDMARKYGFYLGHVLGDPGLRSDSWKPSHLQVDFRDYAFQGNTALPVVLRSDMSYGDVGLHVDLWADKVGSLRAVESRGASVAVASGYCYLRLFAPGVAKDVAAVLGSNPTCADVADMYITCAKYSLAATDKVSVDHVSAEHYSISHGSMVFSSVYRRLRELRSCKLGAEPQVVDIFESNADDSHCHVLGLDLNYLKGADLGLGVPWRYTYLVEFPKLEGHFISNLSDAHFSDGSRSYCSADTSLVVRSIGGIKFQFETNTPTFWMNVANTKGPLVNGFNCSTVTHSDAFKLAVSDKLKDRYYLKLPPDKLNYTVRSRYTSTFNQVPVVITEVVVDVSQSQWFDICIPANAMVFIDAVRLEGEGFMPDMHVGACTFQDIDPNMSKTLAVVPNSAGYITCSFWSIHSRNTGFVVFNVSKFVV